MQRRKEYQPQNQDGCIETYACGRVNGNPLIAAIYARTNPLDRKFHVNVQTKVRNCCDYCVEKGWKVAYIFVDQDESQEKTGKLNFERMMRKAKSGDFDVIVFWKLGKLDDSISSVSRNATMNSQCGQNYG
jgi:hypothetical protein